MGIEIRTRRTYFGNITNQRPPSAKPLTPAQYRRLLDDIGDLLERGRRRAQEAVGRELVRTYHAIGQRLLAAKLAGRAGYGTAMLQRLSDELGVKLRVLQLAVAFAKVYPDEPPERGLRWVHYRALLGLSDPEQREWYERQAVQEAWSGSKLEKAIRRQQYREAAPPEPGAAARDYVQEELARAGFVMLKTDKIDIYPRYVAHVFYQPGEDDKERVFTAGRYLNQRLVDKGLAKAL